MTWPIQQEQTQIRQQTTSASRSMPLYLLHRHATCTTRGARRRSASIYDPRPAEPFFGCNTVLRGRCELATLSGDEPARANRVLASYGGDESNLPWFGAGNCHDWMAGAVRALEREELVDAGAGDYWTGMVGKGPVAMTAGWQSRGSIVVQNASFGAGSGGKVDARWTERENPKVGRLGEERKNPFVRTR